MHDILSSIVFDEIYIQLFPATSQTWSHCSHVLWELNQDCKARNIYIQKRTYS